MWMPLQGSDGNRNPWPRLHDGLKQDSTVLNLMAILCWRRYRLKKAAAASAPATKPKSGVVFGTSSIEKV